MPFSRIKTTRNGQFETLRVQGQPVTELWEDIQDVLQAYAQQFPKAQHLSLAQPFGNPADGTIDWYGPACSPIPPEKQSQINQIYTQTRDYIIQWAKQNSGRNIDPDIVSLLPTALTIPNIDNLYYNPHGLILTAWGHRAISGMLAKGNLQGKTLPDVPPAAPDPEPRPEPEEKTTSEEPASQPSSPHASASNDQTTSQQRTSQRFTSSHTFTQERLVILPWYRVWYTRWLALFPAWHWFPALTFGLPLFLLLLLALSTSLGPALWGVGLGWALLASLLIGLGLWMRRFWRWGFVLLGLLLLLWLLGTLLMGLFSARHLSVPPGLGSINGVSSSIGGACSNGQLPVHTPLAPPAAPVHTAVPLDAPHRQTAMNDLQTARSRGGNKGALEISLAWNDPSDLDLHVQPPAGQEISFSKRASQGGVLDVDANVGTPTSPIVQHPIEHITWPVRPQPGTYSIRVIPYHMRSNGEPVPYHVTVYEDGQPVQEYNAEARTDNDRQSFNFTLPEPPAGTQDQGAGQAPSPAPDQAPQAPIDGDHAPHPGTQSLPDGGSSPPPATSL